MKTKSKILYKESCSFALNGVNKSEAFNKLSAIQAPLEAESLFLYFYKG